VGLNLDIGSAQSLGKRQRQEDRIAVLPGGLLVLSDGMGGAVGGDVAAETIVGVVSDALKDSAAAGSALRNAALAANKALRSRTRDEPDLEGMGGTVVIVRLTSEGALYFSMGDSPLWRVRGGRAERLNADHSVGGMLDAQAARGEISTEEAMSRRDRNSITSVLTGAAVKGMRMDETADAIPLGGGDVLVLASDGLDTLQPDQIAETVERAASAQQAADSLIAAVAAIDKPRQDNCSVIVARVG
jgi:serine/threonine protein phosphatase PrpC